MATSDLSRIEKRIVLRAPRERVWKALTNIEEFSKWFGVKSAGVFAPGARVEMTATMKGSTETMRVIVDVQQMVEGRLFSWRWHPGMPDPGVDYSKEPTTLVEFHLEDQEDGTLVTVVETGFDQITLERRARIFDQNEKGWAFQMQSLERYVEPA